MPQPVSLSVNLNKIALLRNQRDVGYPSVIQAAETLIDAGVNGLTVHPRPDERHIRKSDVVELSALLAAHPGIEFNIEGFPSEDFLALACRAAPDQVTLVPDAPDQSTSDHGWLVAHHRPLLEASIAQLQAAGARVSLFMDAEPEAMAAARAVGADRVELYTGPYAQAFGGPEGGATLQRYAEAGRAAAACGLGLNAGHDLTLDNLPAILDALPDLQEVSIGHAFTADALWLGLEGAVQAYLGALTSRRRKCA